MLLCFHDYHNIHFKHADYKTMKIRIVESLLANTIKLKFVYKIVCNKKYKLFIYVDEYNVKKGFVLYKKYVKDDKVFYYIPLLGVHPQCRHLGYGKKILDSLFDIFQSRETNAIVQLHSLDNTTGFYEKYGFTKIDRSQYVHNECLHQNDVLMEYAI